MIALEHFVGIVPTEMRVVTHSVLGGYLTMDLGAQ